MMQDCPNSWARADALVQGEDEGNWSWLGAIYIPGNGEANGDAGE